MPISALEVLGFDDVHDVATFPHLVDALRSAFAVPAVVPDRLQYTIQNELSAGGTLLLMPAWRPDSRIGVKLVSVFPDNDRRNLPTVMGHYVLLSARTGEVLALIDGRALTLWRTAAVSALAAGLLAPRAQRLLVVGTGALAPYLARAHAAGRHLEAVQVWGRNRDRARLVVQALRREGLKAEIAAPLSEAAADADLVCCATASDRALIMGDWLSPGTHLDLVGSFTPEMREVDEVAVRRSTVFVDTFRALTESGDLAGPVASGALEAADVADLTGLVNGCGKALPGTDLTLFKSVGTALADLAVAEALVGATKDRETLSP